MQSKSYEQEQDEAKSNTIAVHRDSILWYLRQKLQECGNSQATMMEKRILREMEKNRSVLAKSRTAALSDLRPFENTPVPILKTTPSSAAHLEVQGLYPEQDLTPEQIQTFEKENQDMLKHYESTLGQVRYVADGLAFILILTGFQDGRKVPR